MEIVLSIATPLGTSRETDLIYETCAVTVRDKELLADLIVLRMSDLNIILDMDWLTVYHANMNCSQRIVTFTPLDQPSFQILGTTRPAAIQIISALKAKKFVSKGCTGYLASLVETSKVKPRVKDIPIVCDYSTYSGGTPWATT